MPGLRQEHLLAPLQRWAIVLMLGLCAACGAPTPAPSATPAPTLRLAIAAVPAGQGRLSTWSARYQAEHPGTACEILPMNAVDAQEALSHGKVDLALLDQPPAPAYHGVLTATEIVREPLALVVHQANPLRDLASAAAADLLSGRVANWSQVGGPDLEVHVYLLPESAGEMVTLAGQALGGRRLAPQAIVCTTRDSLRQAVAADPGGIGVLLYSARQEQVAALRLDGTEPDDPAYPWQVPFFLVYGPETPHQGLNFVRIVRGYER